MTKKMVFTLALISLLLMLEGSVLASAIPAILSNDPVLVGAGDISYCTNDRDEATAQLLENLGGTVFTLGDNVYPDGTISQFIDCYEPTWGRYQDRTRPSPGNHDYNTAGAAGYYEYFGAAASPLQPNCTSNCEGYYSYNLGDWHIIALNSEISIAAGSEQEQWLRADLAANLRTCTLAYWHKPRFSSGGKGNYISAQPLWQALYDYEADVVLNGHDHIYERFAPQNPSGEADSARGIREFVVGTGGANLSGFSTIQANSEVRDNTSWGVLKLVLHPTSYEWEFIPVAGSTFTDSGSANCVGKAPVPTPKPSGLIFKDNFESRNLSAWSAKQIDGGDLRVSRAAAKAGNFGLQAMIDDNNPIFVTDKSPTGETLYQARFYFDPNSVKMAAGNSHFIFLGYKGNSTLIVRVQFRFSNGHYQLRVALRDDVSTWKNSKWVTIDDASHLIQLTWEAATGPNKNDGRLVLRIDGIRKATLIGVDNDTLRIDTVRLGAINGVDSGTRGIYYFDAFNSWQ